MAERTTQAVPAARRRTPAEMAIDMAMLQQAAGSPLMQLLPNSPAGGAPVMLPNSPVLAPAAVATAAASAAARQGSRELAPAKQTRQDKPLFADRPAYRQRGYAPSDGFPIAAGVAAAADRAAQVMDQNSVMQRDLLTAPSAPGGGAAPRGTGRTVAQDAANAGRALAAGGALGPAGLVGTLGSALARFFTGGSDDDAIVTTPVAAPAANTPARQAIAAVTEQGPITPQDALAQILTSAFTSGVSFDELQGLGQLVPAAVKPVTSAKDRNAAIAGDIANSIFTSAVAQAQQLADPAEQQAALQKAREEYWARYAGVNPLQLAQAAILSNAQQE